MSPNGGNSPLRGARHPVIHDAVASQSATSSAAAAPSRRMIARSARTTASGTNQTQW